MARYRGGPRRGRRRSTGWYVAAVGVILAVWWGYRQLGTQTPSDAEATVAVNASPVSASDEPVDTPNRPLPHDTNPTRPPVLPPKRVQTPPQDDTVAATIRTGREALAAGDLIKARSSFNDALERCADESECSFLRDELTRIASETILSPRIMEGDPLVERYVIRPGDSLANIAGVHKVSSDLLAQINGIADKDMIRAGQSIKIIEGPFRAVVDKSDYALDVYLDDTFIKRCRVGLGADDSTPNGTWHVQTKLENPTYYPPRGGRVVAADDPKNPLGERWIGLAGVSGEALNQLRYGIHGTIDPDSIGKSISLGCIRMHNKDVEALFTYLVEKHSEVTVHE